jgi:hypothetical protein
MAPNEVAVVDAPAIRPGDAMIVVPWVADPGP